MSMSKYGCASRCLLKMNTRVSVGAAEKRGETSISAAASVSNPAAISRVRRSPALLTNTKCFDFARIHDSFGSGNGIGFSV